MTTAQSAMHSSRRRGATMDLSSSTGADGSERGASARRTRDPGQRAARFPAADGRPKDNPRCARCRRGSTDPRRRTLARRGPEAAIRYHRLRCSNGPRCPPGPRVISARLPGARSVSIAAYVLAGSRLEAPRPGRRRPLHGAPHLQGHGRATHRPARSARRSRASAARSTPPPTASRPSTGSASRAARPSARWTSSAS